MTLTQFLGMQDDNSDLIMPLDTVMIIVNSPRIQVQGPV